jgi:hypothetical protein
MVTVLVSPHAVARYQERVDPSASDAAAEAALLSACAAPAVDLESAARAGFIAKRYVTVGQSALALVRWEQTIAVVVTVLPKHKPRRAWKPDRERALERELPSLIDEHMTVIHEDTCVECRAPIYDTDQGMCDRCWRLLDEDQGII